MLHIIMTAKIPYVISKAHPDYKRPYVSQKFGAIDETLIDTFFVKKAAEFIYERTDEEDIESVEDIEFFWDNYYNESYMSNAPWDARIFINGEWKNVCPTSDKIFEYIQQIKSKEKIFERQFEDQSEDE